MNLRPSAQNVNVGVVIGMLEPDADTVVATVALDGGSHVASKPETPVKSGNASVAFALPR